MSDLHPIHAHADLPKKDLEQTALLHQGNLPDSLLTAFGVRMIRNYYRYLLASKSEGLFLMKDDAVRGAAVLSLDPSTLMKRTFLNSMFSAGCVVSVLLRPASVIGAAKSLLQGEKEIDQLRGIPEVVQLYADFASRRQGVATQLLKSVEKYLEEKGINSYFVRTVHEPSNNALKFYQAKNFEQVTIQPVNGKDYVFLIKRVRAS